MPRFFFDTIDNGKVTVDRSGIVLKDRRAVRNEAIGALPHMALDSLPDGDSHEFAVQVRDDIGGSVFRATLSFRSEWQD
jgi:hypothetical protein